MGARGRPVRGAALLTALVLLAGCAGSATEAMPARSSEPTPSGTSSGSAATAAPVSPSPSASATPTPAGAAVAALARLPVKGKAPLTGYDRELFGPRWSDVDRNGCDTRNDILRRDLRPFAVKPGTNGCVVLNGLLADPFSGRTIAFQRGSQTSADVQIDHVVALANAWQTGAFRWSADQRLRFANDPLNLLAVDGRLNLAKRDSDAASWLPPYRAGRCPMVARQIAAKQQYGLWVTGAERDAMARVLAGCPDEPLPVS